ncbi:MAG: YlmH/Sll1252 family protein [Lachnospiraceae bacterium]
MNNEQVLKGRILDLAKKSYQQNIYTYSHFLSVDEQTIISSFKDEFSYITSNYYGGHALAERQVLGFGSEKELGYEGTFPITAICITPLIEKFGETLSHRDYLGAIMNLGIQRDTLGDILIKDKTAYLFCLHSITDYIMENLTKVRHTTVKCEIVDTNIPALQPTLQEESFPVASLRLDGIIAYLTKTSRKETLEFFADKKVTLNGVITGRNSINLKEGDIFSVRGYGKFIFSGVGGNTRKGKIYVQVKRYL